jgi:hypothetical protein
MKINPISRVLGASGNFKHNSKHNPKLGYSKLGYSKLPRVPRDGKQTNNYSTESYSEFLSWIVEDLIDSRKVKTGELEIKANSKLIRYGALSSTYFFNAEYSAMFLGNKDNLVRRWKYFYEHSHEDGKHNPLDYCNEQLDSLVKNSGNELEGKACNGTIKIKRH